MKRSLSSIPLFVALLSGCGAPHDLSEKYYLVVGNTKSPYWEEAAAGLRRAASELRVTASVAGPETFAPDRQAAEFRRIAAMKPAGILVSASDPKLLGPEIDAAVAAGIPVIAIDADAPGSKRLTFVGTNNYEAGLMAGRDLVRRLKGKGQVMVFTTAGQTNLEERLTGYRAALESAPGVAIAEVVDIRGNPSKAFDRVTEVLESGKPVVDAFVSLEGQSPGDVAEVLKRKGGGKVVMAMDTVEATLNAIDNGQISATVAQKPFTMAYVGLRLLADLRLYKMARLDANFSEDPHSSMPRFIDTGATLIDKTHLSGYRENLRRTKAEAK
ncbi:MAG: substrate-binding domain-containing protein [Bryobacteraceae bacterium]